MGSDLTESGGAATVPGRRPANRRGRPVARTATPTWVNPRVAVGVLLVLVSVVGGARVFATADRYADVYVAAHDLVPGEHVTPADLSVGRVRLDGQGGYYVAASGRPPIGYVMRRFVGAHEFVPLGALTSPATAPATRYVTVPVQPGHLPSDLGHGDVVDVYVTAKAGSGAPAAPPRLVLGAAVVEARDGGSRTFSGDTTSAVVLDVPAAIVADVVHAVESGVIDLVRVPRAAVQSGLVPAAASS